MGYFIDPEGNYPRHGGDIELVVPGWREGGDPLPDGWVEVAEGEAPDVPEGYDLTEAEPHIVDGVLTRNFVVVARPAAE